MWRSSVGGHLGVDGQGEQPQHLAARTGPAEVAPTSTPRSASSTSLMNPWLPALWIQPRADSGTGRRPHPDLEPLVPGARAR